MLPDTRAFLVLTRHRVPFVIIGGHAVNFHGYVRSTEDADAIWIRTSESKVALLAALTELHAQYIGNEKDPATGLEKMYPVTPSYINVSHLIMVWTDIGFLDLFDYIPGYLDADVNEFYAESHERDGLRYASRSWLEKMKRAAGRSKDLDDLANLP